MEEHKLLERSLGEVLRRTKMMIGRFPSEQSLLSLHWVVFDLVISHSKQALFTDIERQ